MDESATRFLTSPKTAESTARRRRLLKKRPTDLDVTWLPNLNDKQKSSLQYGLTINQYKLQVLHY